VDLNPLFSSVLSKPGKKEAPSPFDKQVADSVRQLCVERNWRVSMQKKVWADQIRLLRKEGVGQDAIAQTFAGYAAAVKAGKTTFKITDCEQFRKRFELLERIAAKMPPPASARAQEIARLTTLTAKWPKAVSPEHVAALAQRYISFAEDLGTRLAKAKKLLEAKKGKTGQDRAVLLAAEKAHVRVASADSFARQCLERIRDEVRKWKDWSGDTQMYHPSLGSKYAGVRRAVLDGCSEVTWTLLKEAIR
jgi:hypothetical protein